jgi:hypothetical protein
MIPIRAWGLAVTAVLGASSFVLAANPPTTVYAKLFGPPKPKPGPVARTSNAAPRVAAPVGPSPELMATSLRAEQDAWERRIAVCTKLRQVAIESNDEELIKQVDELERQAAALYTARTKALGLPKTATEPDVKQAARKLTTPPEGLDTAVRTAEARTPKDVIREVP